jgi:hypothetical protein
VALLPPLPIEPPVEVDPALAPVPPVSIPPVEPPEPSVPVAPPLPASPIAVAQAARATAAAMLAVTKPIDRREGVGIFMIDNARIIAYGLTCATLFRRELTWESYCECVWARDPEASVVASVAVWEEICSSLVQSTGGCIQLKGFLRNETRRS